MFSTTLLTTLLPHFLVTQNSDLLCIDLTDFEHFQTELAQDRLQSLPNWLAVTFVLFLCGLLGMVYNYKNFLVTIMCVEVMYLGAVTSFVLYGLAFRDPSAFIFGLLILIFGACESAVGLGLLVAVYRFDHKIDFDFFNLLGG